MLVGSVLLCALWKESHISLLWLHCENCTWRFAFKTCSCLSDISHWAASSCVICYWDWYERGIWEWERTELKTEKEMPPNLSAVVFAVVCWVLSCSEKFLKACNLLSLILNSRACSPPCNALALIHQSLSWGNMYHCDTLLPSNWFWKCANKHECAGWKSWEM